MAFYTSRVDDCGYEIERRQSARSTGSNKSCSTISSHINLSSRSSDSQSSFQFINSAAHIEKNSDNSETSSLDDEGQLKEFAENVSDIVPPLELDLNSEENFQSTRESDSYRKHLAAPRLELRPDLAYDNWLSAKRKLIMTEAQRRKQEEEQKKIEQENRKRLAEIKYKQWLETKLHDVKGRSDDSLKADYENDIKTIKPKVSEEEIQAKVEEWERMKQIEQQRRRIEKQQEEQRRIELEQQRRRMATEAWDKWISEAANKPKPVPLNRGIFTLRGTISDIFINPNEWQRLDVIPQED